MITKESVEASVARVVALLSNPKLAPCPRNSVIRDMRRVLIAQIFWGDRVVAAMRDGVDYTVYAENMQRAMDNGVVDSFMVACHNGD